MTGFISNLKTELKGDRVIWVLISLMTLVSLLGVYSSTGSLSHKEQETSIEDSINKALIDKPEFVQYDELLIRRLNNYLVVLLN